MALAITNRGTGTHNTGAASFGLSPTSNFAAGSTAVLCVAADNSAAGGSTNNINSVTDSLGNTWTKRQFPVFDPGAASAGVQGAIFDCEQNVGVLQTSTVITVDFGASTVAKTWTLTQIAPAAGKGARFRTGGNKSAGATGTAATSGATASVNIGEVVVCAIFIEAGTTQSCTGDSDSTNGTWSALQYTEIGSTTSGSCIASQAKLQTTANSAQTYDVTLGISSDYHSSWAIYQEVDLAQSVTPSPGSATSTGANMGQTFGGIGATPSAGAATSTGDNLDPTFGGIGSTPAAGSAAGAGASPSQTLTLGQTMGAGGAQSGGADILLPTDQEVTPTPGAAAAAGASPAQAFGAVGRTPTPAAGTSTGEDLDQAFGGVSRTPTPAAGSSAAASPGTTFGVVSRTAAGGAATAAGASPAGSLGGVSRTMSAGASGSGGTPAAGLGALERTLGAGGAVAGGGGFSSYQPGAPNGHTRRRRIRYGRRRRYADDL